MPTPLPHPVDPQDERHVASRQVGDAVRRLSLSVDAYVAAVGRHHQHHTADVHAAGAVKQAAEQGEPLTAGMLGQILGLSPAAVTAMLGRMERAGHVRRVRGGPDGRRVYLEPGELSARDSRRHFEPLNTAYDQVLETCAPEELALVADVLDRLERATADAQREIDAAAGSVMAQETATGDEAI